MTVIEFIAGRPCLEEIEGYLLGLRTQMEVLDNPQYKEIDADIIGPLEIWKAKLMSGKETPYPSSLPREWVYQKGRPPKKLRKPHEYASQENQSTQGEQAGQAGGKTLDLNARRRKSGGKKPVRILHRGR